MIHTAHHTVTLHSVLQCVAVCCSVLQTITSYVCLLEGVIPYVYLLKEGGERSERNANKMAPLLTSMTHMYVCRMKRHTYVHIHIYICITYIYIYMYVCIYIYIYMYMFIHKTHAPRLGLVDVEGSTPLCASPALAPRGHLHLHPRP